MFPWLGETGAVVDTVMLDVSVDGANLDPIESQYLIRASARWVNFNAGNRNC